MAADQNNTSQTKKKLALTIKTPRGVKFNEEADMIIMRLIDGDFGVLPGHEAISTVLGDGTLRIINNGVEKKLAVFGGIVEVEDTRVDIYSTIAQMPHEIDLERAEADRKEALAELYEKPVDEDMNVHASIRRALVRIEVSLHSDEEGYFDDDDGEEE